MVTSRSPCSWRSIAGSRLCILPPFFCLWQSGVLQKLLDLSRCSCHTVNAGFPISDFMPGILKAAQIGRLCDYSSRRVPYLVEKGWIRGERINPGGKHVFLKDTPKLRAWLARIKRARKHGFQFRKDMSFERACAGLRYALNQAKADGLTAIQKHQVRRELEPLVEVYRALVT
jgi:hypothetical protein